MEKKGINELKAGAIISYVNLALSCVIPLAYTPIMLRYLGQSEYGLYSIANSVISYLSLLSFGMGSAVIRYLAICRAENDLKGVERTTGTFIKIFSCLSLLVMVVGFALSIGGDLFFSKGLTVEEIEKLKRLIMVMTFSVIISFITSVFSSVAIAYEKYIFRKIIDLISTALVPVFNLIVLYWGSGSIGLAIVGLVCQLLYLIVFAYYCIKKLHIHPRFDKAPKGFLKEIWSFSAFIFLGCIVDLLYWSTDKVLIGARIGSAAAAVYNIGGVFTNMMQNMSGAISNVFTTRVTTMVATNKSKEQLSELLIRIGRIQYWVISLIISGYIVFGQYFIKFWAGKEYLEAYWIALVTMIPLAIPLIENIAFNIIVAQNKHQFRAIIYFIIAIINIIATYLVLPIYGIIGAAVCTGIAYILGNGIIMNIYYLRVIKLNIKAFWMNILKMSVIPAIMVIVGNIFFSVVIKPSNLIGLFIGIIIYTLIFVWSSWYFTLNEYEKNLVKDIATKLKR